MTRHGLPSHHPAILTWREAIALTPRASASKIRPSNRGLFHRSRLGKQPIAGLQMTGTHRGADRHPASKLHQNPKSP
jgi:hypothetical protein